MLVQFFPDALMLHLRRPNSAACGWKDASEGSKNTQGLAQATEGAWRGDNP